MSALTKYVPAVLFLCALVLRLVGIDWALPNAGRYFSYHPDEGTVVLASLGVNPWALKLDPGFYNYGSFPLLVNGALIHLFEALGMIGRSESLPSAGAYLVCRMVSVCAGAGTVLPLYFTGRMLYGRGAGIAAALFYAVAPLAVLHAHFATVDVTATFLVAMSLCFAVRRTTEGAGKHDLLLAGIFAGLAAATKYNAGLVLLASGAAWILLPKDARKWRELAVCAGAAFVSFLAAFPAVLLNGRGVGKTIWEESVHTSATTHGAVFQNTPVGFVYHLGNFWWGMILISLVVAVGLGFALVRLARGHKQEWPLWAFAIPYFILIGLAQVKFARYTLPLYPPLLLMAGAVVWPLGKGRGIGASAGVLCGVSALAASAAFNTSMTGVDARDAAAAFLREKGVRSVGFATGPWFYSPTLNPLFTAPRPDIAKRSASETQNIRLIPADGEWNIEQLRRENPDAVAVTDLGEYGDALRVKNPAAYAYLNELSNTHPVRTIFPKSNPFPFILPSFDYEIIDESGGATDARQIRLPTHFLPHDMQYTLPNVVVWTKK